MWNSFTYTENTTAIYTEGKTMQTLLHNLQGNKPIQSKEVKKRFKKSNCKRQPVSYPEITWKQPWKYIQTNLQTWGHQFSYAQSVCYRKVLTRETALPDVCKFLCSNITISTWHADSYSLLVFKSYWFNLISFLFFFFLALSAVGFDFFRCMELLNCFRLFNLHSPNIFCFLGADY